MLGRYLPTYGRALTFDSSWRPSLTEHNKCAAQNGGNDQSAPKMRQVRYNCIKFGHHIGTILRIASFFMINIGNNMELSPKCQFVTRSQIIRSVKIIHRQAGLPVEQLRRNHLIGAAS